MKGKSDFQTLLERINIHENVINDQKINFGADCSCLIKQLNKMKMRIEDV